MKSKIEWMDGYYLADATAAHFARCADLGNTFLKTDAAGAVRALWKLADPDLRSTIACRVSVWRNRGTDRVHRVGQAVLARESSRGDLRGE